MFLLPGFGWVGITFSPRDRLTLSAYLVNQQLATMPSVAAISTDALSTTSGGGTLH